MQTEVYIIMILSQKLCLDSWFWTVKINALYCSVHILIISKWSIDFYYTEEKIDQRTNMEQPHAMKSYILHT